MNAQQPDFPSRYVFQQNGFYCPSDQWHLVFFDEFDGVGNDPTALDPTKWYKHYPYSIPYDRLHGFNDPCFTPTERQTYLDQNVVVSGGICSLKVERQANVYEGRIMPFTSGMIHSRKSFRYGTFEIRCKLPDGHGYWPAFWLWGGSEIDVFECEHENPNKIHCTMHQQGKMWGESYSCETDLSADFHTYKVVWERDYINWYFDGTRIRHQPRYYSLLAQELDCPYIPPGEKKEYLLPKDFMNIIANLAVGGEDDCGNGSGFGNGYNGSTPSTDAMEIDYIRAWQRLPENSSENLCHRVVTGPNVICSGGSYTYTLESSVEAVEPNSIVWATSANLTIVTTDNNNVVITPNGTGSAWVEATVTTSPPGLCPQLTFRKNIWLGLPAQPQFQYQTFPCNGSVLACVINDNPENSYEWTSLDLPITINEGSCVTMGIFPHIFYTAKTIHFSVSIFNTEIGSTQNKSWFYDYIDYWRRCFV